MGETRKRYCIYFIEMLGEPGTYDASVYDGLVDKDLEGVWFQKRFAYLDDVTFKVRSLPRGDALPDPETADGFILGGSYNSVHDDYPWQRAVLAWLPRARTADLPLLAICGAHQLLAAFHHGSVVPVVDGTRVGTLAVALTDAGAGSPLMKSIPRGARFHFANNEHVAAVPRGASLLAYADKLPAAALEYAGRWYSTQFHPEGSAETMGVSWAHSVPRYCDAYDDGDMGDRLIENFVDIVRQHRDRREASLLSGTSRGAVTAEQ